MGCHVGVGCQTMWQCINELVIVYKYSAQMSKPTRYGIVAKGLDVAVQVRMYKVSVKAIQCQVAECRCLVLA